MTMPVEHDLTLYKGQTYSQNITFKYKATGQPIPLDGITAAAQIRPEPNSAQLIAAMACTVYPSEGLVNLALDTEITAAIIPGCYAWDLKLTDGSGKIAYYIEGKFIVRGRVTE